MKKVPANKGLAKAKREPMAAHEAKEGPEPSLLAKLQQEAGNKAVNTLLGQPLQMAPAPIAPELPEEEPQGKAEGSGAAPKVGTHVMGAIDSRRGGGRELEAGLRQQAEEAFGYDFKDVRLHTDSGADELAAGLKAKAFTTGKDIFFRGKDFDPGSPAGKELIGHELTHVVQQHEGLSEPYGRPGDRYEQEADRVGADVFAREGSPEAEMLASLSQPLGNRMMGELLGVQRQEAPDEEEIQMQPEEDPLKLGALSRTIGKGIGGIGSALGMGGKPKEPGPKPEWKDIPQVASDKGQKGYGPNPQTGGLPTPLLEEKPIGGKKNPTIVGPKGEKPKPKPKLGKKNKWKFEEF